MTNNRHQDPHFVRSFIKTKCLPKSSNSVFTMNRDLQTNLLANDKTDEQLSQLF